MFVRISKRNRISAFCGWAEDSVGFRIYTNSSTSFDELAIETSPRLGDGCRCAIHIVCYTVCLLEITAKIYHCSHQYLKHLNKWGITALSRGGMCIGTVLLQRSCL